MSWRIQSAWRCLLDFCPSTKQLVFLKSLISNNSPSPFLSLPLFPCMHNIASSKRDPQPSCSSFSLWDVQRSSTLLPAGEGFWWTFHACIHPSFLSLSSPIVLLLWRVHRERRWCPPMWHRLIISLFVGDSQIFALHGKAASPPLAEKQRSPRCATYCLTNFIFFSGQGLRWQRAISCQGGEEQDCSVKQTTCFPVHAYSDSFFPT